jgi:hypothetical protein
MRERIGEEKYCKCGLLYAILVLDRISMYFVSGTSFSVSNVIMVFGTFTLWGLDIWSKVQMFVGQFVEWEWSSFC